MAYGEKYSMIWSSLKRNGVITIYEKDYVGAIDTTVRVLMNTLRITRSFDDWNSPLMGLRCEFSMANDKSDYFELMPLLLATEQKYFIKVTDIDTTTVTLFEGYISLENVQQKYSRHSDIKIVASSYLNKLENFEPDIFVDSVSPKVFINVIDSCLRGTGNPCNINVASNLLPTEDFDRTDVSFLSLTGTIPELFWENNVEVKDAKYVLETILKTFKCFIYWWDGEWYIEEFYSIGTRGEPDATSTEKKYYHYITGTTYIPASTVALKLVEAPTLILHDLQFIELSQIIKTFTGNYKNSIELNDQRYNSIVTPLFTTPIETTSILVPDVADREVKQFEESGVYYWEYEGTKYHTIEISKQRKRTTSPNYSGDLVRGTYYGARIDFKEGNELTIKFKWCDVSNTVFTIIDNGPYTINDVMEKFILRHRLYIILKTDNILTDIYLYKDGENWRYATMLSTASTVPQFTIDQNFTEDADKRFQVYEPTITIPLDDVTAGGTSAALSGVYDIVIGIGESTLTNEGNWDATPPTIRMGDVVVTLNGEDLPDNLIEGSIVTDFLNEETFNLDLFDLDDISYKNGIRRDTNLVQFTNRWTRPTTLFIHPISDVLLEQLARETKQIRLSVEATVINRDSLLRIFDIYKDEKQSDMLFALVSFVHNVMIDEYEVVLKEYDNSSTITL